MLYYCRGCSAPLVTGVESCANCGYLFEKVVPEFTQRETFNPHKITYWPPRKPTPFELFCMEIWNWLKRAPMPVKLALVVVIVGLLVAKGVYDSQNAGIPTNSPVLVVSDDGSTYAAQTSRMAAADGYGDDSDDATGSEGTDDEDPSAPLSASEASSVQDALKDMASQVGTSGASSSAIIPDDPAATLAMSDMTPDEESELQSQLNEIAGTAAAANAVIAPDTPANRPKVSSAAMSADAPQPQEASSSEADASPTPAPSSTGSSAPPGHSGPGNTGGNGGGQASGPSPLPLASLQNQQSSPQLQTRQENANAAQGVPHQNEQPSQSPSGQQHGGNTTIVLYSNHETVQQSPEQYRRPFVIVMHRRTGPSKAIRRMRSLYSTARSHFVTFESKQSSPQYVLDHAGEANELTTYVKAACLVYPRLKPSERTEWKRELIAMLLWKIEMSDVVRAVQALNSSPNA